MPNAYIYIYNFHVNLKDLARAKQTEKEAELKGT
jgi:hypothetical protein